MNKKLKNQLFLEYEKEMNFVNKLKEVKSHLRFQKNTEEMPKEKKKIWTIYVPALSAAFVCLFVVVSLSVAHSGVNKSHNFEGAPSTLTTESLEENFASFDSNLSTSFDTSFSS